MLEVTYHRNMFHCAQLLQFSLLYVTDYNDVMLVYMILLDCMLWQLDTSVKQPDQRIYCTCRLPASPNANWDLVIIQSPNTTISCPACLLTFTSSAIGQYQQLWQLTQSDKWQELRVEQYQYIYLPDGKVYHAVDQIDRCEWFCMLMLHTGAPALLTAERLVWY